MLLKLPFQPLLRHRKASMSQGMLPWPGIMKAKKKPLAEKTLSDLGLDAGEFGLGARKIKILELTPPPARAEGKIIEGESPQEKAAELAKLLHEEAKVI